MNALQQSKTQPSSTADAFLLDCNVYDDYLETFITNADVRYLRNMKYCRTLVMLNYRSTTDIYTPTQFETRKELVREQLFPPKYSPVQFSSKERSLDPVINELAAREKPNLQKIISTIVFMYDRDNVGFEISGFIDLDESLRHASLKLPGARDWHGIFSERIMLRPRNTDLSFFNAHRGTVKFSDSDNYIVVHDVKNGLSFMHRGDHKIICVDTTRESVKRNYSRTMQYSNRYGYVMFYDHIIRKKI